MYRKRETKARLSISVPAWIAQWTRAEAKANGVSVSAVVEAAIERMQARERESRP